MIRINALFRLFSLGSIYVHTVWLCFVAFWGSVLQCRFFKHYTHLRSSWLVAVCMLMPSLLFWTSGVLKEAVISAALGVLLYGLLPAKGNRGKLIHILFILIGTWVLLFTKSYLLGCLLPGLLAWYWASKTSNKQVISKFIIVNVSLFGLVYIAKYLNAHWDLAYILTFKRGEYIYLAEHTGAGSLLYNNYLDFTWGNIFLECPMALGYVLFRPFITEAHSLLLLLPALENLLFLLLLLAIACSWPLKKLDNKAFWLFCINFVLLNYLLVGLTTPVMGSIVRYKVTAWPFLLIVLLMLFNEKAFLQRFWKR